MNRGSKPSQRTKQRVLGELRKALSNADFVSWINTPNKAFNGTRPVRLLETWKGVEALRRTIYQLSSGEFK